MTGWDFVALAAIFLFGVPHGGLMLPLLDAVAGL